MPIGLDPIATYAFHVEIDSVDHRPVQGGRAGCPSASGSSSTGEQAARASPS